MPGQDTIGFDLAEWYVKTDGDPWGPFDVLDIRTLAAQGQVSASTLVSREGDGVWMRLKDAVPDWEHAAEPAAEPEPQPPDPPLHVFYARVWLALLESYVGLAIGLALWVTFELLRDPGWVEWGDLAAYVGVFAATLAVSAVFGDKEHVEVTARVVRHVSAGRTASELPINEIDRVRSLTGVLGRLTGTRTIRSVSGKKLTINRRAYRAQDYAELMGVLGLDADS